MSRQDEVRLVRTACPAHCAGNSCGVLAHVKDGIVVKLEPGEFPDPRVRRICLRGLASAQVTYHPDRLQHPLRRVGERGEGKWQQVTWDEALEGIAAKMKEIAAKYGPEAMAWVLGGPGGGTTKFGTYLRLAAYTQGTRVSTFGYGDAAGPCASYATFGTLGHGPFIGGLEDPALNILWGTNPAEAGPFRMRELWDAKERGVKLVVIDPLFTITASKADQYIPVRPGTDAALALGMMNVILNEGLHDVAFITKHSVGPYLVRCDNGLYLREKELGAPEPGRYLVWDTQSNQACAVDQAGVVPALTGSYTVQGIECKPSFQLLVELIDQYTPERAAQITEVPVDTIRRLALAYGRSKPACIQTHMGLQRTYYGDLSVRAVCTLATITGNISLPGGPGHRPFVLNWDAFLRPVSKGYSRMGVLTMYDAITEGKPYPVKGAWFAFINFLNQSANTGKMIKELVPNLDLIVVTDLFMTLTAQYADYVLPVCTYLEHSDLVLGPMPYLQLQDRAIKPLYESKSDIAIVSALAKKLGLGEHFDKSEEQFVELLLASGHPSVEGITVETLRKGPIATKAPPGQEETRFRTPTGKIEFYVERLKPLGQELPFYNEPRESNRQPLAKKYPLVYVQGHSKFRTHSMFANVGWMLEINPEPEVEMNPLDAAPRGIGSGDMVIVFNERGETKLKAKLSEGIRPGVVNITEGWWSSQFAKGGVNHLTYETINPAQAAIFEPNMACNDVLVEVKKAED